MREMSATDAKYLIPVYRRFPVTLAYGEGERVYDTQGRVYWDFLAGIGVNSLGYHHPLVQAALHESAALLHTSNLFYHEPGLELSRRMADITGGYQSLWVNSGAEANEAALKLARRAGLQTGRRAIIALSGAFHGRTMGALSITPVSHYQDPFAPLVPECYSVPFGDLDALRQGLSRWRPAAVFFEPIQGENGVVVPPPGYLAEASRVVRASGALVIMDEVQAGIGRTGQWFAHQAEGVEADVITVAKGLGAGVPIGGILARPQVASAFEAGDHGSTFGGNPLASRMALAVTGWLLQGGLDWVRLRGKEMEAALTGLQARYPDLVTAVRGRGLMWGMVIRGPAPLAVQKALDLGLIINAPRPDVLRFLPPLIVRSEAIAAMAEILDRILADLKASRDF